jgi:hypothetical protein
MINISGIMWKDRRLGIALHKLRPGDNKFKVTVLNCTKEPHFPGVYIINLEKAIEKYGISIINRGDLRGIWVPLNDLQGMRKVKEPIIKEKCEYCGLPAVKQESAPVDQEPDPESGGQSIIYGKVWLCEDHLEAFENNEDIFEPQRRED